MITAGKALYLDLNGNFGAVRYSMDLLLYRLDAMVLAQSIPSTMPCPAKDSDRLIISQKDKLRHDGITLARYIRNEARLDIFGMIQEHYHYLSRLTSHDYYIEQGYQSARDAILGLFVYGNASRRSPYQNRAAALDSGAIRLQIEPAIKEINCGKTMPLSEKRRLAVVSSAIYMRDGVFTYARAGAKMLLIGKDVEEAIQYAHEKIRYPLTDATPVRELPHRNSIMAPKRFAITSNL
jgi:hypothetical protein